MQRANDHHRRPLPARATGTRHILFDMPGDDGMIDKASRFWSRVDKSGECWVWKGSVTPPGYGRIGYDGKRGYAHRLSWELANGPIPDGMFVLHRCDNRVCVRPEHLFLGTQSDNMADMDAKGRRVMPTPEQQLRGEAHPWAKFTESEVKEIRRLWEAGCTQGAIARRFRTTQSYVSEIVSRRKWAHVRSTRDESPGDDGCNGCGYPVRPWEEHCRRCCDRMTADGECCLADASSDAVSGAQNRTESHGTGEHEAQGVRTQYGRLQALREDEAMSEAIEGELLSVGGPARLLDVGRGCYVRCEEVVAIHDGSLTKEELGRMVVSPFIDSVKALVVLRGGLLMPAYVSAATLRKRWEAAMGVGE